MYLSQLLGAPVENQQSERQGKIVDVLAATEQVGSSAATYPFAALVADDQDRRWRVPIRALEQHDTGWRVLQPLTEFVPQPETTTEAEVYLARDVLDKQVIDIEHKKAVRVNDVCFGDDWQLLGIDNSALGLVRRLAPSWLLTTRSRSAPHGLIPWSQIELIGQRPDGLIQESTGETPILPTTRAPSGHLAELHPADIASIVHQLTVEQGARLIERLDDDTAADTMEEIDTARQGQILENIQAGRAADILQEMGPDEVADLLAHLPEERAQQLLHLMNPTESEEVQELLGYEDDSAGGLMTTDYVVLNQTRTAQEALAAVRANILEHDVRIAYIYCVADETLDECHLLGVISLWDLLIADPAQTLQEIMETDLVTVHPDTPPATVAETIAKYNLLAVPVVNEEGILQGVVTVDDALDVLLPPERRRGPRRMY